MMKKFTSCSLSGKLCTTSFFVAIFILLTLLSTQSYSQTKNYATTVSNTSGPGMSSLLGCGVGGLSPCYTTPTVVNPGNAITSSDATFARLNSYGGVALGLAGYNGEIELKFPGVLPAGTTSFIRINSDVALLDQLLSGNLGALLSGVVGNVALGDHFIEVGARNTSGTTVTTGSSADAFTSTPNIKLIKDGNGFFYMAITPAQAYDRVFVRDNTRALLLSAPNHTDVYYAFYTSGNDPCAQAYATSYEGTGLTASVLGLGKAGVTNPENAINANQNDFSELSLGLLGVAGSISQDFYFYQPSNAGDDFNLRFAASNALLTAGVLNNLTVTAYNGNTQVYSASANSLLNLDLLALLTSGQAATVPFSPGVAFDRVKVTLSSLLDANLAQTIQIYGLTRTAGRPTFAVGGNAISACYNTTATLSAITPNTNELIWYSAIEGGAPLATVPFNGTFTTPALTANTTYYVAARRLTCTQESARVPVTITVNPQIIFNTTTLSNATIGSAYTRQINPATGGTPGFTYTLATPGTLPAGLTLSSTGLISGTPTVTGSFPLSIVATDTKGCSVTTSFNLTVTAALALTPGALPDGITGTPYPTQIIPSATGGTGPYTYSAPTLPPGLSFDPGTREITGTPTQAGIYTIPVTVTDANGNTVTSNFTVKITDPLVLPPAVLAEGVTGTPYPTQTIPSAAGGTGPYTYSAPTLPPGLVFNPTTREITGTPTTPGTYVVPVTVTDADGKTITTNYTIKVVDPLVLPPATLANGTVGTPYVPQNIPSATGGVGPYTYVATNLPPGLSFDPATREITGTPTQAGNYSVSVTVTDSEGRTASNSYAIQVTGVLNLPTATLPNGVVGDLYPTQTLPAVTGGTSPYTYVANNLPPGLNFNTTTREITGTPTLGGTFTVSVTATDATNNVVNTDYTILVTVNPPVVAAATVCAGSPATLTVSNQVPGVTYNWYASTGSTPLATNNAGTFITPPVTSATTFYVESVSGTAVSSRTAVAVNLNPAATPATINTNNQVINSGQTTVLTASADPGNTISWYAAPTGGTALTTGNSFTTPALTANTTYYVETTNAQGCASSSRVPVTVTVIAGGGNPNCNAANAQSSGINAILCALCNIANPGFSTDANPNNFTRITLGVGLGATGFQQLIFPTAGTATDSIRLDLALPTGLADVSVLGNITVNIMNGATVVSSSQLNSSLINLALLNGNRFSATVFAGVPFDRVELRFGSLLSAISSLDIYGATLVYPNPTLTSGNQTICSGNTATLSATANGGTTLTWYDAPTGGSVLANGGTYTTPNLTATTTYYIEVSKNGCANTNRVPVVVTVTPAIVLPVLAPIANACAGNTATLSVSNPQTGVTYNWYNVATGGTPVFTGTTFTTPALNANTTYYVEGAIGSCLGSSRVPAVITVNPRPVSPQVSASSTTVNSGQTAILTASSTDTDVNFNWYDSATGTTPIFTGATFVTPPLTATTSYYVEAVSNTTGCTSVNRVQVTVNVTTGVPVPAPCETATTQTNGVNGVLAILAGVSNPNLAIDADAQSASSLVMPVGLLASVYQRVGFGSLSTIGDTVRVKISSPGRLLSLSLLGSAEITTYNGANSNNDATAINNPVLNLQLLNGGTEAIITLVPTAVFDGVELRLNSGVLGALTSLNLNYVQRTLKAPVVTVSAGPICIGGTAVLTVSNPVAGLTYRWYDQNQVYIAGSDGVTFTTPALTGDTKFYVTAVDPAVGCESAKTLVNVTTEPAPVAPQLVASTVNICTGGSAILQVANPQAGFTYKWYDASNVYQTGQDGISFTVPNVTANVSYSVEAVNACGVASATKTIGNIVPGATLDAPVVTPGDVTITSGTSVAYTATSSASGATLRWYDATGTLIPGAGAQFTTPVLTTSTFYEVEAIVLPGGCLSARTRVNVTIVPPTPGTVPCGTATIDAAAQVGGAITIGSGVNNRAAAVDNDINTGSNLVLGVTALNGFVSHRLGFVGGLSNIGDALTVKISSPAHLLSASVLQSLTLTTYQGAVANPDAMLLSNNLIQVNVLPDGSSATITYIPTSRFDGVELKLSSGLVALLSSVNFDYASRATQAPTVTATAVSACQGTAAVLSVQNPQANLTYTWYDGVTPVGNGATFSTPTTLTVGTHVYSVSAYLTAGPTPCESAKTDVTVTITAPPAPPVPVAGNPGSTCVGTPVTLAVTPVAGIVYNWYDAATGGNLLVNNNNSFTTSASLIAGTYTYYVEAVNGSNCNSSTRTAISITVNPNATAADITVTGNTTVCTASTTTLTATSTITNPVFTWYSNAALTTVVANGATFTTPAITAATTYYVTVSGDNVCANLPGTGKPVTLTVNPIAGMADLSISGATTACASTPIVLTASSTTVTNPVFTWYSDAALNTPVNTGATFNIPGLTATTTYYVTVKGDNKCENTPATAKAVTITVNPASTISDLSVSGNTTICQNTTATLSAVSTTVTNPVFTWYSDASLTTVAAVGANFTTPSLSATTTYYVTVKGDNKCENSPANARVVVITVKDYATAADITVSNANACAGSSVSLMASSLTVTQPVFTWYSDASLTVPVFTGPTYNLPAVTATTTFYVTVKGTNKCENAAADAKVVTVTVNPLSTATDVIVNGGTTVCAGSTATLTATSLTVTNPIFTWYSNAALTNIAFVGPIFTTPVLNAATTTYYVTVKGDNKCENAPGNARVVVITTNPAATATDLSVTGATTICQNASATLTATSTTVINPIFTWYSNAALTTVAATGSSFTTPPLSANTTYYVTVKGDNKCENSPANAKVVTITVNGAATAADINLNNASVCAGSGVTLTASSVTVTNPVFTWYSDASLTAPVFTGPTYTLPALAATTTLYVTVKGDNKCENTAATAKVVTITVNPRSTSADVILTGGTSVCAGSSAVLTASSTTVTNPVFTWYSDASFNTVAFIGAVFTTPVLTANTTYYVTVKGDNKCENVVGNARVVNVTVNALPQPPVVATTGTNICSGESTILTVQNVQTGVTFQWYDAPTNGNLLFTGTSYTTAILNANTSYYVQAVGAGGCGSTLARTLVSVTVNLKPGAPTLSANSINVCAGSTGVLSISNPQAGITYNWYTAAVGGTLAGSGSTFTTAAINANTNYYVEAVNGSCTSASRTSASVLVSAAPNAPAQVGVANNGLCSGSTALLSITNPEASLTYKWYASSTGGTALAQGVNFTTPALNATTNFYVESVNAGGCASATRTLATVNILPILATPVVTVQSTTAASVTFSWNAVAGATGYEISTNDGATWQNPTTGILATLQLITGLKPDQGVTIIVRALGQTGCQTSANSTPVTGKSTNPLGNDVYIPNVFTPNNDGKNDIFLVYGNKIAGVKMNIYTQWGQLIFQTESATQGWDGTFKGVHQPAGVYVYMVDIMATDGTSSMRRGTVTLVR